MDRTNSFFVKIATLAGVLVSALLASAPVWAQSVGDAAHGAKLFLQCRACHTVGQGETSGVGPNLWGVVGSKAATHPGYHYSTALSSSRIVWSPEMLDRWLTQPTALAPGTNMAFQGVASPQARKDIIAYLTTLGAKEAKKGAKIATKGRTHRRLASAAQAGSR